MTRGQGDFPNWGAIRAQLWCARRARLSPSGQPQALTFAIADTTASMFLPFSAATQMRPESTP